ncbi:calcium/sodium antiporter [Butyricicoccus sp. Marseille-Q5471]|uniref:calcium/sodium antiporter n=1 Tax=Butyricicoccus sp. Marseille-Q5471 TaxID=3039493 RepID=UPI002F3E928F
MMSFVYLIVGFVLLVVGADKFVAGASAAARRLGVPALIVGLTVVAFGTSAPELAVSVTAAMSGANEIAVGNVVGSNIFNLLVVAGLSAVLCPLALDRDILRRDWPLSMAAAAILTAMVAWNGDISRLEGLVLLALFAGLMVLQLRPALQNRAALLAQKDENEVQMKPSLIAVNIVIGLAAIILGGQLAVNGATGIARMFGLSETLIGLTIVAIGTSLPELVTSLVAARRGQNDIAMGNVIGSNLFNILLILGVSAVISPISVLPTAVIDGAILLVVSLLFYLPARKGTLSRPVGAVMALTYVAYTAYLICR